MFPLQAQSHFTPAERALVPTGWVGTIADLDILEKRKSLAPAGV
jgi:hypothetical protein